MHYILSEEQSMIGSFFTRYLLNQCMFGTIVPITTGHLPIDFRHQIIYNGFIEQKTPLHLEKGKFTTWRRGWVPSQRSVKSSELYFSRPAEKRISKNSITQLGESPLITTNFQNIQSYEFQPDPHLTCSSTLVKVFTDNGRAILTSFTVCPISSPLSQAFTSILSSMFE
jgi:hypothetical protein